MNSESVPLKRAALAFGMVAAGLFLIAFRVALVRVRAVVVDGASMTPALVPEDYVLVDSRAYANRAPRPGEVVLTLDPRETGLTLLKRVGDVSAAGIELLGDNAARSTDSREFGLVAPGLLRGRVLLVYWPPSRFGRVR